MWLPRPTSFKPVANVFGGDPNLRVSDLIDWEAENWDTSKVRSIFLPCDAEVILKLRIIDSMEQDELVYIYIKNGLFSVSSAYNVLEDNLLTVEGRSGQADGAAVERAWKKYVVPSHDPEDQRIYMARLSQCSSMQGQSASS